RTSTLAGRRCCVQQPRTFGPSMWSVRQLSTRRPSSVCGPTAVTSTPSMASDLRWTSIDRHLAMMRPSLRISLPSPDCLR
ncbi:uncharacterized protein METZ01_LOCUS272116, partial [marine metagenome]